jgi:RNase P subunit RPR2
MKPMQHRIKMNECPSCHKQLDAASSVDDNLRPEPGEITICLYCGHIMAFDDDLSFRELTSKEMIEVAGDPRILAIQRARQEVMKKSKS